MAHGKVKLALRLAKIINRDEAGVVQAGGGSSLLLEALDEGGVVAVAAVDDFKSHLAAQVGVSALEDGGKAAPA
jgi:hypothetical protein